MLRSVNCNRNYDARYTLLVFKNIYSIAMLKFYIISANSYYSRAEFFFPVECRSVVLVYSLLSVESLVEICSYTGT